jgi:urease accessory protein UreF
MSKHLYLLKAEILNLLEKADDESTLVKVIKLLQESEEGETDWWDEMTDEQREQQEQADEDIRLGRNLFSHEEAMKRIQFMLNDTKNNQSDWRD